MIQVGHHTMCLVEIGGDVTQGTVRSSLDVRRGFRILFQAEDGGAHDTEIIQVRIDGCPEINVGMNRVRIADETLGHGESHDIGVEEDEGADAVDGGFSWYRTRIVPCSSQEPEIPGVLVLEKRSLDQAVGSLRKARRNHRIILKDETERCLVIHHPLPDRNMREGASDATNGVQLLMRTAGLGDDIPLRHGGNALVLLEIQSLSIQAQEALDGDVLETGLGLKAFPAIQATLQRDTEGRDLLDAPWGPLASDLR